MAEPESISRSRGAEAILDCISDGVITIDLQKRVTFLNRAMQTMLGYEVPDSGMLLACDVLIQSNICSSQDCVLERALRGERVSNFEAIVRRRDGIQVPVSINTDFLLDQEGKLIGLIEVIRDISLVRELTAKTVEVSELKHRLEEHVQFDHIVGRSSLMQHIFAKLPAIAASKSSVLITGESGTGKELIAYALHAHSPRRQAPFVVVNGSSLSEGVLESELFGHVKGAFTNAYVDKPGRFEVADGGTIFLDEIGEMSLATQVKLLGVLERGRFERVGSNNTISVDVRIVAATNRNLEEAVREGRFREDLYYRIRVIPIALPPLRERSEDIPLLVNHFREKFNREMDKQIVGLSPQSLMALEQYPFPGNIRELQNVMEHAFVCCEDHLIQFEHLSADLQRHFFEHQEWSDSETLQTVERQAICRALDKAGWHFKEASQQLGIGRSTLWRKVRQFGIKQKLS
ncbi:MAG: sigma 54-interacting transcriptional regulator [Nitrospirota bacterium]|nr:sigma 54-interacting transcriptional regulator [Nitrospirota bacterium]MDH5774872.1 sigma 54-interacting transcriptional regulator [Nitrospirota bacterium]